MQKKVVEDKVIGKFGKIENHILQIVDWVSCAHNSLKGHQISHNKRIDFTFTEYPVYSCCFCVVDC